MDSVPRQQYIFEDRDFEDLLRVYVNLGFHRDLVTHWAIPRRDACKLLELIDVHRPKKILEIGTFVGFSTLLMAKFGHSVVHVHSVDPNFPLQVELGAMNTNVHDSNTEVRHQELALSAAQSLGLDSKITFHAGGFSTGSNYASIKTDPLCTVPVIGRQLGEACGPFDMIFIDGLHYDEAVLSDLRLAQEFLDSKGVIVLHDVIGGWGSNVRRAVFQFLREQPTFVFNHGRYADLFDSIGVLQADHSVRETKDPHAVLECPENFFDNQEFITNIVSILIRLCSPRSVIYFGLDRFGLLPCFAEFGVTNLRHVGNRSHVNESQSSDLIDFHACNFEEIYASEGTFDLCLMVGDVDEMDATTSMNLIDSCVLSSETVFFAVTPPGESGAAGPGSRPMGWWTKKFFEKGFRFHDVIRPSLEPLRFSYSYSPVYKVGSSKFSNIFLAKREGAVDDTSEKLLEKVLIEKESRIEDLILQAVYTDILLQDLLRKWKNSLDVVVDLQSEIKKSNDQSLQEIRDMREQNKKQEIDLEESFRKIDDMQDRNKDLINELNTYQNLPKKILDIPLPALAWISESPRILKVLQYFTHK